MPNIMSKSMARSELPGSVIDVLRSNVHFEMGSVIVGTTARAYYQNFTNAFVGTVLTDYNCMITRKSGRIITAGTPAALNAQLSAGSIGVRNISGAQGTYVVAFLAVGKYKSYS